MSEADRIIDSMSPWELVAFAKMGGTVKPGALSQAVAALPQPVIVTRTTPAGRVLYRTVPPGKVCPRCTRRKPRLEFHKDARHRDGLSTNCKRCHNDIGEVARKRHALAVA